MDLKEQKYVCTLAECKSLTRASERLYISQPALSLYINNVEKNLGAPLFERNGRKFELTWLGKQYVEKASQMLELERQFKAVMRQTEQEDAGQVRIGIAQRRGIWFLPAVLSVYEREWPQVDVVIREGNLAGMVNRMGNVLESVTCPAYPVIDEIKAQMMKNGAVNAMMSGSGPTVFGIFDDPDKAEFARDQLKISGLSKQTFLTTVSKPGGTKYGKK